jgi:hypothetical protein
VTNNLAESFNNMIKDHKGKHLDDLLDTIRQQILMKWISAHYARTWGTTGTLARMGVQKI